MTFVMVLTVIVGAHVHQPIRVGGYPTYLECRKAQSNLTDRIRFAYSYGDNIERVSATGECQAEQPLPPSVQESN